MADKQQDIRLNYTSPVVVSDGHVVMIQENTNIPTLLFFQARDQHEGHIHGDVVAAVRFTNIQELQNLSDAINDTVKRHLEREP